MSSKAFRVRGKGKCDEGKGIIRIKQEGKTKKEKETHVWVKEERFHAFNGDVSMFKCVSLSKQAWVSQRNVMKSVS
jgi:hypothetical protein